MVHCVVLVKQVPKDSRFEVDRDTGLLKRENVGTMTNPDDLHALEAALQLRERYGGVVTVVSMGPPQTEETLREALAMGADRAVLVSDSNFAGADTLMTTTVLKMAVEKLAPYDLVLCGLGSLDGNTGQVPVQTSQALGIPLITRVREMEIRGTKFWATRNLGHEFQEIECPLPVVLGVNKFWNRPRIPTLLGIRKAYRKELLRWDARELACPDGFSCRTQSPTWVWKLFPVEHARKNVVLGGTLEELVTGVQEVLMGENVLKKRVVEGE
ncbi:MAG: electron transfer flavoprotein subunit beta/FixA family protein [Promethearchaeota archaeon]